MASLASLAEFRTSQPALASVSDAQVQSALDAVSVWARGIIGQVLVSDFGTGYTVKIRWSSVFSNRFILPTKFATLITKIDGVAYTGVLGTDYWMDGEEVTMPSLSPKNSSPFFTVEVTGGSACPTDLKNAVIELASRMITKDAGHEISSQSLGQRSVTFVKDSEPSVLSAQSVVAKYQPAVA